MDRYEEDTAAAVAAALDGKLRRGFMNSMELDALPGLLEPGEQVVSAANATCGRRAGLLALTDRRLLFLFTQELRDELLLDEVEGVESTAGGMFAPSTLTIRLTKRTVEFENVGPKERLDELVEVLRRS